MRRAQKLGIRTIGAREVLSFAVPAPTPDAPRHLCWQVDLHHGACCASCTDADGANLMGVRAALDANWTDVRKMPLAELEVSERSRAERSGVPLPLSLSRAHARAHARTQTQARANVRVLSSFLFDCCSIVVRLLFSRHNTRSGLSIEGNALASHSPPFGLAVLSSSAAATRFRTSRAI